MVKLSKLQAVWGEGALTKLFELRERAQEGSEALPREAALRRRSCAMRSRESCEVRGGGRLVALGVTFGSIAFGRDCWRVMVEVGEL